MSNLGNKEVFSKNLNYYMNLYNKDRNKICKDLELKYSTVRDWTKGIAYPRIDKIEMLANYFNIEKSDLIEEKNKNQEEEELKILLNALRKSGFIKPDEEDLTEEELDRLLKFYEANKEFIKNPK